eukprot:3608437-Prymnesium_polylepis.1
MHVQQMVVAAQADDMAAVALGSALAYAAEQGMTEEPSVRSAAGLVVRAHRVREVRLYLASRLKMPVPVSTDSSKAVGAAP